MATADRLEVGEMHGDEQSRQQDDPDVHKRGVKELCAERRRPVLDERIDFEQLSRVDEKSGETDKEQKAFEQARFAMADDVRSPPKLE